MIRGHLPVGEALSYRCLWPRASGAREAARCVSTGVSLPCAERCSLLFAECPKGPQSDEQQGVWWTTYRPASHPLLPGPLLVPTVPDAGRLVAFEGPWECCFSWQESIVLIVWAGPPQQQASGTRPALPRAEHTAWNLSDLILVRLL